MKRFNILASVAIVGLSGLMVQPAMADNRGKGSIGIGSAPRAGGGGRPNRPAPQYSQPNYTGGNYIVNNRPSNGAFRNGGFVTPSIVFQPSYVAPNYYLPGDFYARSNYYVPSYASPIIIYPPSTGGFIFTPRQGGGPNRYSLTFGPLNR
jgi:hypothetical protein